MIYGFVLEFVNNSLVSDFFLVFFFSFLVAKYQENLDLQRKLQLVIIDFKKYISLPI